MNDQNKLWRDAWEYESEEDEGEDVGHMDEEDLDAQAGTAAAGGEKKEGEGAAGGEGKKEGEDKGAGGKEGGDKDKEK